MDYLTHLMRRKADSSSWWVHAAKEAALLGRYKIITGKDDDVYLARFWLHEPSRNAKTSDPHGSQSTMIHHILRGDEEEHLHDHPWDFVSTILNGGYIETIYEENHEKERVLVDKQISSGETIKRKASDPHRLKNVEQDTWTIVTTGPKVRSWGFVTKEEKWIPWRELRE